MHWQRKYLWAGFWLLPMIEVNYHRIGEAGMLYAKFGFLFWYYELEVVSRKLTYAKSVRIGSLIPTLLVLSRWRRSLTIKAFVGNKDWALWEWEAA